MNQYSGKLTDYNIGENQRNLRETFLPPMA